MSEQDSYRKVSQAAIVAVLPEVTQDTPTELQVEPVQPTKGELHAIVDAQIAGVDPAMGAGAVTAATLRITQATGDAGVASLATIAAKDFATQTTLAAILADTALIPADPAREGGNLATLAAVDFATQTTLAVLNAKIPAAPATEGGNLATIAGDTTSMDAKIPADPAKESGKLTEIDTAIDALSAKINDYPTLGTAAEVLAVSNVNAALAVALAAGKYLLWCSCDVWWLQDAAPVAVWEDVTCKPLPAGQLVPVTLSAQKIGAITNGATGKLIAIPVS